MRKFAVFTLLSMAVLIAGCSWFGHKKTDITNVKYDVESCNTYFRVIDCVLENDNNPYYSEEDREDVRIEVKELQEAYKQLDNDTLTEVCDERLAEFIKFKDEFAELGCSLD